MPPEFDAGISNIQMSSKFGNWNVRQKECIRELECPAKMSGINVRQQIPCPAGLPRLPTSRCNGVICNTPNITDERGSEGPRMLIFISYYYTIPPPSSPASNTIQRRHSTTVTAIPMTRNSGGTQRQRHIHHTGIIIHLASTTRFRDFITSFTTASNHLR
jgi:hypothetical protein